MVNFYPPYVNCSPNATLSQVAGKCSSCPKGLLQLAMITDHIDYIRKVAGVEHVGIGSDFNGIDK